MKQPKYWLVGANWDGENKAPKFIRNGVWVLGKKDDDVQYAKARKMKKGDRIAIKRMPGKRPGLAIDHIGTVKGVLNETEVVVCTVDWFATDLGRYLPDVPRHSQSVHGPFERDQEKWLAKVFYI